MIVVRHRPAIARDVDDEGLVTPVRTYWRLACTCGIAAERHPVRAFAVRDRDVHLETVAAPHAERCRQVPAHTSGWWEHCAVCADQRALF